MTDRKMRAGAALHARHLEKGEPVAPPLVQASMYHLPGEPENYAGYGRSDNPTWDVVEHLLGHIEQADCLLFPSGMAAITAALLSCLKAGDRVLLPSDGYYATRVLAERFLSRMGIDVETRPTVAFDNGGFDGLAAVFVETPSNPGLDLVDISAVAGAAHRAGAKVIADNTTMTAFGQRPLEFGADIVVASDTKAPGGHSDLLMGHVACRDKALLELMRDWRKFSGTIPGPAEAWLLHRGLETLEVRFDCMCSNASLLAERLRDHPRIGTVRYPGLADDPSHALAARQMERFGFLIGMTFETAEEAEAFIVACPLLQPATSFGGVHSSAERRIRWGDDVAPGFVRLSVGCEPAEELWAAMDATLNAM